MCPTHSPDARFAMRLSLGFGALMLLGKGAAWYITGSAAILSDALESVVHVLAVAFAAFSLWLSARPANREYLYGFERISYFSAGFEGGMIVLAAFSIIIAAARKWMTGLEFERLGAGTVMVAAAALVNAALGWYLVWTGRREGSLILEANGKHVLTDSWTSLGVVVGLLLTLWTGWKPFDPLIAFAVAVNILWSGAELMWRSAKGLLDFSDPAAGSDLRRSLDELCAELGLQYHGVRFRDTSQRLLVEVHLLFPFEMRLGDAHRRATELEERLKARLQRPTDVVTHLEAEEDHDAAHPSTHYTGKPAHKAAADR